jgi:hypothetical protein
MKVGRDRGADLAGRGREEAGAEASVQPVGETCARPSDVARFGG